MTIFATGVFTSCSSSDDDSSDVTSGQATITYTIYLSSTVTKFYNVKFIYKENGKTQEETLTDASFETVKTNNDSYTYKKYTKTITETLSSDKTTTYNCSYSLNRNSTAVTEDNYDKNILDVNETTIYVENAAIQVTGEDVEVHLYHNIELEKYEDFLSRRFNDRAESASLSVKYSEGDAAIYGETDESVLSNVNIALE